MDENVPLLAFFLFEIHPHRVSRMHPKRVIVQIIQLQTTVCGIFTASSLIHKVWQPSSSESMLKSPLCSSAKQKAKSRETDESASEEKTDFKPVTLARVHLNSCI